jgi:heme/copper-type cytochrome/quinol oxidase subunit 2
MPLVRHPKSGEVFSLEDLKPGTVIKGRQVSGIVAIYLMILIFIVIAVLAWIAMSLIAINSIIEREDKLRKFEKEITYHE